MRGSSAREQEPVLELLEWGPSFVVLAAGGMSAESVSRIIAPEWDGLSGSAPRGNCVPESSLRLGRTFRIGLQAEAASRILAPEWDAVSG